jgi:hypothetical protein
MFCSSCGVAVTQGLSYCNYCGARLSVEGDHTSKSAELKPNSLVFGMIIVFVFGLIAITMLMGMMKVIMRFDVGLILAFACLSFLIMLLLEGVFIWHLFRLKRGTKEASDTAIPKGQTTKELDAGQLRALPEAMPSVTEHTTRTLEPVFNERTSK